MHSSLSIDKILRRDDSVGHISMSHHTVTIFSKLIMNNCANTATPSTGKKINLFQKKKKKHFSGYQGIIVHPGDTL